MKNRDSLGDPVLTEPAENALLSFLALANIRKLSNAVRNLQLHYLQQKEPNEIWFLECLPHLEQFFTFCDELEDEYGCE